MAEEETVQTKLAVIGNTVGTIQSELKDVKAIVSSQYLTRTEFEAKFNPISRIVYTVISMIAVSVIGALLTLVVGVGK